MPSVTTPDGLTKYIPGVYGVTKVVSSLPGPLPAFHIPVIVGQADEGRPYNVNSLKYAAESRRSPFELCLTDTACRTYFGVGSEVSTAVKYAKRGGLPFGYVLCASPLTRAVVIVTSTGPVNQFYLYSKKHGAPGGHTKVKVGSGTTLEITPVKHYSLLTANAASGATRVYVKDIGWVRDGMDITLGANAVANVVYTVDTSGTELDSVGQTRYYIDLTTALASNLTTAGYAMVVEYDDTGVLTPDAFGSLQAMLDYLNDTAACPLGGAKHASWTNPAATVALGTATPLKEIAAWGTATAGTSPAPTSSDYDAIITALDAAEWDQFLLDYEVVPQAFLVVDSSSTVHASFRDWALAKRAEGWVVSITCGTAWGDIDLSATDDTNPVVRAEALDCQDVSLWAGGLDRLDAYLSLAPQVFGLRVKGGPGHNLTNDRLRYTEVETAWDERGSGELTALHRAGVGTYRLTTSGGVGYKVSQGLSTLQNNAAAWNEGTDDTPFVMQRDLADFVDRVLREDLDGTQVGADEVTPESIAAVINRRAEKSLKKRGYITEFRILSITLNDGGTGYDVDWSVRLPVTNDYMTTTTRILIGEE